MTQASVIYLLLLFPLFYSIRPSTGPSSIESEIIPISRNQQGEVLCKTRFTKNEMGARMGMRVEYGFCIIANDTLITYRGKTLAPEGNDTEEYHARLKFWDAIFYGETQRRQLGKIVSEVLKGSYYFNSCNTDSFRRDQRLSLAEFEADKGISLSSLKQEALKGVKSSSYLDSKQVHVLYDFGSFVLMKNQRNFDETGIGAEFDYYNGWVNEEGKELNIGFDVSKVNGILFLK